jgi:hypothetical protein
MSRRRRTRSLALASILAAASVTAQAAAASDPMLDGDPIDPQTGEAAVILPGAPWIRPGPDGQFGTADDEISATVLGDVDLVVRAGSVGPDGMPQPSPLRGAVPRGVAEPFGRGTPIDFVVVPSDGSGSGAGGAVVPSYWDGLPLLVAAFGDLDGDGFVGITHLDGDPEDTVQETAELTPLGLQYAVAAGDRAVGQIHVFAGGPRTAPLRIALTATAYAGPFDEHHLEGLVPKGPAVSTRLPFLPEFDPKQSLRLGVFGLLPAEPDGRVAFELEVAGLPNPADSRWGEAYTLRLDGSDPSIGVAEVESGEFASFGVALPPQTLGDLGKRRLRPGIVMGHPGVAVETPRRVLVADDGEASARELTIVPLDTLGNVTEPIEPTWVRVRTDGYVRITHPDTDGDPSREEVLVTDASGAKLVLDDFDGAFDDYDLDRLHLRGGGRNARIQLSLADPDVDDDGTVDGEDGAVLVACEGIGASDPGFDARLDLDGSGVIDAEDIRIVDAHHGLSAIPDGSASSAKKAKKKERKWKQPKLKKPKHVRALKELEKRDEERRKQKDRERKEKDERRKKERGKGAPDAKQLRKDYCPSS